MNKSKRIASNTILLYVRMAILMVTNLITIRLVLSAIGVEDYGIYNAVAGVVTMLSCVSSVLSNATQRYYSYYIGMNDKESLSKVFSVSLDIYLILILGVIILGETAGLWFVNNKLVIPEGRLCAANWTYQLSIATFAATILPMPYLSAILANEKIGAYSLFTSCDYVIKLIFAFMLAKVKGDVLVYYAAFQLVAQVVLMITYIVYGGRKFAECSYRPFKKDPLHKEVLSFSGWTLFGSVAGIGMSQVMTILYNIFWGPIFTAAWAISMQLNNTLTSFSNNIIVALRPPMIKSYSESNDKYLMKLFNIGNKFIFYSLLIIAVPLVLEMETILHAWLKVSDVVTVRYSQLIIIYFLIVALGNPITIIIQAVGKVKQYHIRVELFTLLCPILTYISFKMGFNSYYGYYIMILTLAFAHIVRVLCLKRYYPHFNARDYVVHFIAKAFFILLLVFVFAYLLHISISTPWLRVVAILFLSTVLTVIMALFIGMTKEERNDTIRFAKGIVKKNN